MALSRAARAFNKSPTVENFKRLARERPAEAASWVSQFGDQAKLPRSLLDGIDRTRWETGLSVEEKTKKLDKLLSTHQSSITRFIQHAIKADEATPVDLGWSTVETTQKLFHGRLAKTSSGNLQLKTPKGNYAIAAAEDTELASRDVATFSGNTVSIRGYLQPGKGRTKNLVAVEWTPGKHADFVSGRVAKQGDKIGIRVSPEKFVEVTNREFKALLANWERAGLSFAGEVKQVGKRWVFEGPQPEAVHLLTSLGDPPSTAKGRYEGAITPSPVSSSTPTDIRGPKVATSGYLRRFIAGRIVPATETVPTNPWGTSYPSRAFEMAKAWKGIDGSTAYSDTSGLEFSPVYDGAGTL